MKKKIKQKKKLKGQPDEERIKIGNDGQKKKKTKNKTQKTKLDKTKREQKKSGTIIKGQEEQLGKRGEEATEVNKHRRRIYLEADVTEPETNKTRNRHLPSNLVNDFKKSSPSALSVAPFRNEVRSDLIVDFIPMKFSFGGCPPSW